MSTARIEITGLREFRSSLKQLDAGMPRMIKAVLDESMGLVITAARPHVPTRTGAAAASLRGRSGQLEARITAGTARVSYYAWLDFGGAVGRKGSVQRDYRRGGRYLYPGLAREQADVRALMARGLDRLARDSGLQVD